MGVLVLWLCDETHDLKVVCSNPSIVYGMDIFHINLLQKNEMFVLKMTDNKQKKVRVWQNIWKNTTNIDFSTYWDRDIIANILNADNVAMTFFLHWALSAYPKFWWKFFGKSVFRLKKTLSLVFQEHVIRLIHENPSQLWKFHPVEKVILKKRSGLSTKRLIRLFGCRWSELRKQLTTSVVLLAVKSFHFMFKRLNPTDQRSLS